MIARSAYREPTPAELAETPDCVLVRIATGTRHNERGQIISPPEIPKDLESISVTNWAYEGPRLSLKHAMRPILPQLPSNPRLFDA